MKIYSTASALNVYLAQKISLRKTFLRPLSAIISLLFTPLLAMIDAVLVIPQALLGRNHVSLISSLVGFSLTLLGPMAQITSPETFNYRWLFDMNAQSGNKDKYWTPFRFDFLDPLTT